MLPGMEWLFDPIQMASMAQGITANPGMFADAMAQTGMMPPPIGGPGMFQPGMAPAMPPAPVAPGNPAPMGGPAIAGGFPGGLPPQLGTGTFDQVPQLGASMPPVVGPPPMGAMGPPGNDPMAALRAAGRGAPQGSTDQKPIMSGGISGAGRAPDPKAGKGPSGEMQLLMSLLGGSGAGMVPGLGQLLKGI